MPRRAAAYLRVSSEGQADEDRFGYYRQIAAIRDYAERTDLEVVGEHRDAITGKSVSRKGLDRLIDEAHRYDCVIISSVDRLARDVTSSYQVLANLLASKVQVHSADQGLIDLDEESSLIQFNLQTLFAHLERHKIVARTRAARNAIAAGGGIPNGMRAFGHRTVKRRAEVVPEEAMIMRELYERSAAGETCMALAARLRTRGVQRPRGGAEWTFSDIARLLTNPRYKGELRWGIYDLEVPAIVSPDLWMRGQPGGRGPALKSPLQLLGHIRCGRCGRSMTTYSQAGKGETRRYWSYRCVGYVKDRSCRAGSISMKVLDPAAEQHVRDALADPDQVRQMLAVASTVRDRNGGALAELDKEDARWLEAFRARAITVGELGGYRADVQRRRRALAASTASADQDVSAYASAARAMPFRELLDLAGVVVVVHGRDAIEVQMNGKARSVY